MNLSRTYIHVAFNCLPGSDTITSRPGFDGFPDFGESNLQQRTVG
eukprot:COSAG01_NODE_1709_length_9424_cov_50.603968_1_plen_44_part_10